jgi:hypothetical protein
MDFGSQALERESMLLAAGDGLLACSQIGKAQTRAQVTAVLLGCPPIVKQSFAKYNFKVLASRTFVGVN